MVRINKLILIIVLFLLSCNVLIKSEKSVKNIEKCKFKYTKKVLNDGFEWNSNIVTDCDKFNFKKNTRTIETAYNLFINDVLIDSLSFGELFQFDFEEININRDSLSDFKVVYWNGNYPYEILYIQNEKRNFHKFNLFHRYENLTFLDSNFYYAYSSNNENFNEELDGSSYSVELFHMIDGKLESIRKIYSEFDIEKNRNILIDSSNNSKRIVDYDKNFSF